MLIALLLIVPLAYSAPSQSHHQAAAEHGHTGKSAGVVGICLWAPGFVTTHIGPQITLFLLCHVFSREFTLQPFPWMALFWGISYIWLSCLQVLSYPCNLCPSTRLAEIDQWVQELIEKDTPTSLPAIWAHTHMKIHMNRHIMIVHTPIFLEARWKPCRRSLPTLAIVSRVSLSRSRKPVVKVSPN